MPKNKIAQDDHQKIVDMHNSGIPTKNIAKQYDVCTSCITQLLNKYGICRAAKQYNKINQSEFDNLIKLYTNGFSQAQIAEQYGACPGTVAYILKTHGVIGRYAPLNYTQDEVLAIYDRYMNGTDISDIAKEKSIDSTTIYKLFKKYNLDAKSNSHSKQKYSIDESYFDNIDTPNKAYIVGLLYADGCNHSEGNQIDLSLQEEDKHILETIAKELKTDKPLSFKEYKHIKEIYHNQYDLCITNKHISETLYKLGMVDAKSLILEFPEWLDKSLYSHFVRGYFDGDGCLYLGPKKKSGCEISIVSTQMFISKVQEIIKNQLSVDVRIKTNKRYKPVTKVGVITGMSKIYAFLNWIYQDADLKLNRKYQKYQQFLEYYNNINNSYAS